MIRSAILLSATAAAAVAIAAPAEMAREAKAPPPARLPGFAATLADARPILGPNGWVPVDRAQAWGALVASGRGQRQQARWDYARGLVARGRGPEALGVLQVMAQDDPDLALVASWQLARGVALALVDRPAEALAALGSDALAANPEACAWRMRVMAEAELPQQALAHVRCALPAINARSGRERRPFVLAAARAALDARQAGVAMNWLRLIPDRDPTANLLRGQAALAEGDARKARLLLDRARLRGSREERLEAELVRLEVDVAAGAVPLAKALDRLDRLRFSWRGGRAEAIALRLTSDFAERAQDPRRSLAAGATLVRYFPLGLEAAPTVARLRGILSAALAPDSRLPIDKAAGLYWDYRDIAPAGAEGDLLVSQLAGRLQAAGLYARAAELLHYQLTQRVVDVAQGPLSTRVASLYILAGRPDRALKTLRETNGTPYPDDMQWARRRVEAAALHLLGRKAEALTVLQDLPDGDRLRAEIHWKRQDWASYVREAAPGLPAAGSMSEVAQAQVLRQAIALAMLGREDDLRALQLRYGAAFSRQPTGQVFDLLTASVGAVEPGTLSRAMAMIPSASPAGNFADLIDAAGSPGSAG